MNEVTDITLFFRRSDGKAIEDGSDIAKITLYRREFESDSLLILACAYLIRIFEHYCCIDKNVIQYFIDRFPEHKDVFKRDGYELCGCEVEGLKKFSDIVEPLTGVKGDKGRDAFMEMIHKHNLEHFTIWE